MQALSADMLLLEQHVRSFLRDITPSFEVHTGALMRAGIVDRNSLIALSELTVEERQMKIRKMTRKEAGLSPFVAAMIAWALESW